MSNILLVEPDYRSKFPPLGLLRIATYHKNRGDAITFARGKIASLRDAGWHRIYVSSLFTWELPRTVDTVRYYLSAVSNPSDIVVGGIGATLMPEYVQEKTGCRVVKGPLDKPGILDVDSPAIATMTPDYSLLDSVPWRYQPSNAYFCRVTTGCIRRCKFCAVPLLEPNFGYLQSITEQIKAVNTQFGERQNLVVLDNNILAIENFTDVIREIVDAGFQKGSKLNNRLRTVDFNQGIDARLITDKNARLLSLINLSPVRLAFDHDNVEKAYRKAIRILAKHGFHEFTNYVMYNFLDTPESFYRRLKVNIELSNELNVRITGFPMRYIPIKDITRSYVSKHWYWRYLRGIQCVLLATHGIVSPNHEFFAAAFGECYEEFISVISMPDRYIIHREKYENEQVEWRKRFERLSSTERHEFLIALEKVHKSRDRKTALKEFGKYRDLFEHYYPGGRCPRN